MQEIVFGSDLWPVWQTHPLPSVLHCCGEEFWETDSDTTTTTPYNEDATMSNGALVKDDAHYQHNPNAFVFPGHHDSFSGDYPYYNDYYSDYTANPTTESNMVDPSTSMTALTDSSALSVNASFSFDSDEFVPLLEPDPNVRRSSRQFSTPREEPDFIYSTNWRERPEYREFKGLGLSPKKSDPNKKTRSGMLSTAFESTQHPVIDSFLTCVSLDMGAQVTHWTDDRVEICIRDLERLLRALAYNCSKISPTTSAERRVKAIRRWFDGMPSGAGMTTVRSSYIIKSRNDARGNRAPKLRAFADQLNLKFSCNAPKSPSKKTASLAASH